MKDTLYNLHINKTGKVSDKWQSYLEYYDTIFLPYKDKKISLLEIGVQNGGSLETYSKYFTKANVIVGCDINPLCNGLSYEDDRIHVVVADANTNEALERIKAISDSFDIIIDDGSHISNDVLQSFLNYFPLLKPNGRYIVEDSHTLYYPRYGGGLLNEQGAMSFFKRMTDVINFQFWKEDSTIENVLTTYFRRGIPPFITEGWIESVEFRNSIISIQKSKTANHDKLGERLVIGTEANVQTWGENGPTTNIRMV